MGGDSPFSSISLLLLISDKGKKLNINVVGGGSKRKCQDGVTVISQTCNVCLARLIDS